MMAKRVLFLHSAGAQGPGKGSYELTSYLNQSLSKTHRLICPPMPDPENPTYLTWKRRLEKELDLIDDDIILIGHSLGGSVLLKYFSEMPYQKPISGLFIIASPFWGEEGWEYDEFRLQKNFAAHLTSIPKIFFYHSLDDAFVPSAHVYRYTENLPEACIRIFSNRGHNFDVPFPELIDDIKAL